LDRACREWTAKHSAIPAPLNYKGFPASLCVSVNDAVCHGIPDERPFKNGDIVNLDVTPILNGYHGDTNATFIVGQVDERVRRFVETAREAMWAGIRQVRPGNTVGDIGHAIETHVKARGYSVVLEYCGHGIGRNFHEDPVIMHVGKPKHGVILKPGMTFTIEPMINMGAPQTRLDQDGWTARTADGSLSAQFEHTVLVTSDGVEVLTLGEGEPPPSS
jgi:methionyl aminopeptidase